MTPDAVCHLPVVALVQIPDADGHVPCRHVVVCRDVHRTDGKHIVWTVYPQPYQHCQGCGRRDFTDHPGDHPHVIVNGVEWIADAGHYALPLPRALDVMVSRVKGSLS